MTYRFVFMAVVLVLAFIGFGYMHESVHVAIYNSYGVDSKIDLINYFPSFVTISNEACPNETCNLAHNLNEIISYPLVVFFALFIVLKMDRIKEEELDKKERALDREFNL